MEELFYHTVLLLAKLVADKVGTMANKRHGEVPFEEIE